MKQTTKLTVFFCFLFASLADAQTFKWKNCGSASDAIQLRDLQITPHPITIPTVATFELTVDISNDLDDPIKTEFKLAKPVFGFPVPVPCTNGVGSCTYDDWCVLCKTCSCPVSAGNQIMSTTMNVTSSVPTGKYNVEIRFTSATNQKGCVQITEVELK